jgi:6-pyruvoyltetrahydropterin/6-carboxytetrahydropterin synthase
MIRKRFTLEAAHFLPDHDGPCRQMHGHSWVIVVEIQSPTLVADGPKRYMVADFSDVSAAVRPLIARLDHTVLNDVLPYPTSEALAQWLYDQVAAVWPVGPARLVGVQVSETASSVAGYRP